MKKKVKHCGNQHVFNNKGKNSKNKGKKKLMRGNICYFPELKKQEVFNERQWMQTIEERQRSPHMAVTMGNRLLSSTR